MNKDKEQRMYLRPYGARRGDGFVQLSFTLEGKLDARLEEAARKLVEKMGFKKVVVAWAEEIAEAYSWFVVYGVTDAYIDPSTIVIEEKKHNVIPHHELEELVKEKIGKKLIVVGATTGFDAHTVGLDAILNVKGYAGDHGLESYSCFEVYNLKSQIANETFVRKLKELNADVMLLSQVVTQQDIHIKNSRELISLLKMEGLYDRLIKILGGPRISSELAKQLGFDEGFGRGTLPQEVATYIVEEYLRREKDAEQ